MPNWNIGAQILLPWLGFAGLRRGVPPASIGTKTSPGNTPEVKAGQRYQGREAGNVRAGSLASPVEWVLAKFLVVSWGFRTILSPRWSRKAKEPPRSWFWARSDTHSDTVLVPSSGWLLVYAARNESAKSRSKRSWRQAQVAEMQR
jgi:hypothetical protein